MKDDLISRQAAIETVKKHYRVDNDLLEVIAYEIEALPSAQLAQDLPNGCTDTISRVAALSALNGLTEIYLNNLPPTIYKADAVETVKSLPSTQPERDIPKKPNETTDRTWGIPKKQAVCPNCDAYLGMILFISENGKTKVTYCESCGQAINWEGWDFDE